MGTYDLKFYKRGGGMKAFHEVRSYGSDFRVWCQTYENISFLSHWHKEIELIYVSDGICRINVGDQSMVAQGGDLVICDSGHIHYSDSYEEENRLHFLVFDPRIISTKYEYSRFLNPLVTATELEGYGLSERLKALFMDVPKELIGQGKHYEEVVKARIIEFWYLLERSLPRSSGNEVSYTRRMEQMSEFRQFLSYMEEHYPENITLEFAAKKMNFSSSHFSRMFKKLTGINFLTYLNMLRVEKAMEFLQGTTMKITDVGMSCGFNNIRTFNRVFKEVTGCTPSQFGKGAENVPSYRRRKELESYQPSYYLQKYSQKRYVENDSMTLIKNK